MTGVTLHESPPRHPFENPVLLVSDDRTDKEWVFEVAEYDGYATTRLVCLYDQSEEKERVVHQDDNTTIPWPIADAVSEYDDVDAIKNPVENRPEDDDSSLLPRLSDLRE